ncbi:LytR family transcriptional regulator [Treponema phagedenis]|nr:LCP family protein [Treponema phagedenis]QEJ96454.1 LytR family transcriptional regulator [Treponema phagedenis]QEJ99612.1 LytR family transcriptional regulator [Treponema phagedenis]QEK02235.1 LytR family transcriptional regulator [Treponema phagedenis]QEK05167.1 LytR family transcriptional regulator [Treponema phagedenis]
MKLMTAGKNIIFLIIILFILIGTSIAVIFSMKTDPIDTSLSKDNILKVLFIIEDKNIPVSANIIAYYPQTKRAAMFDIPHNIGLILQSLGRTDGISALYTEKGIEVYKQEVEKLTGIQVPFYFICSLQDFSELTDLLSGLSVFIPTPIDIDSEEHGKILLPSGSIVLDGDKMHDYLIYTNEDDAEGESDVRKQKAVLAFLRSINDHGDEIFNTDRYNIFNSLIKSNIKGKDFKKLIQSICKLDSERLVPQRFSGARRTVDGKNLLFPFRDGQQIKEIVRQTLAVLASEDGAAFERVYALEILNGTDTHRLAKTTADIYQSFGYDVVRVDNAAEQNIEKTLLIDRIGNPAVAKIVGQVIKCQNITTAEITDDGHGVETGIDFTLILGSDFNGYFVTSGK